MEMPAQRLRGQVPKVAQSWDRTSRSVSSVLPGCGVMQQEITLETNTAILSKKGCLGILAWAVSRVVCMHVFGWDSYLVPLPATTPQSAESTIYPALAESNATIY